MTTLTEHIMVAGAKNYPPMLEKSMYDSWASRIRLFIKGKKNGRMMLDSIDNGPLVYSTVVENRQTRPKKYSELTEAQQLQEDCDVQATNIILHGLLLDLYGLGEILYEYYWRFSQLINDMHTIGMTMQQVQVNTKFLNALPPERSKFITNVKLAKSLYTTNYDQLYAYLSQHKRHANEVCIMRERYPNPLALVANSQTLYNPSQSSQHLGLKSTFTRMTFVGDEDLISSCLCDSSFINPQMSNHFNELHCSAQCLTQLRIFKKCSVSHAVVDFQVSAPFFVIRSIQSQVKSGDDASFLGNVVTSSCVKPSWREIVSLTFYKERIRLTTSTKKWHSYLLWHQSFHLQTINSERLPIPEIRQPFKMEESQFNKFKEDKLRVLLAGGTEELLQP
nr:hypothetical protein [Tanacetum cinerariifolium]